MHIQNTDSHNRITVVYLFDTANVSVEAEATTQNKNKEADLTKSPELNVNAALTTLEAELTLIFE
jgi:hypothetical protein